MRMKSFSCPFVSISSFLAFIPSNVSLDSKWQSFVFRAVWVGECGVDWPLVLCQSRTLELVYREYTRFVTLLDTRNGLLECGVSDGCLTAAQAEDIASKQLDRERNQLVVSIIVRKSIGCFQKAMLCLIKSKQGHVARLIAEEEGSFISLIV
jgi:hypothetical protein